MGSPPAGRPRRLAFCAAVALAVAAELFLAAKSVGTNDVELFRYFLRRFHELGAGGLYEREPLFNHPPPVLHLLRLVEGLARASGLSFPLCLRLPGIAAGLGSALVLWRLLGREPEGRPGAARLAATALAPAGVLVAGFHGNTDPLMVFLVLLAIAWAPERAALAGIAFGASLGVKLVPVVLAPAILAFLPSARRRAAFAAAAIAALAILSLPYALEAPSAVARNVLGYGGLYGQWGVSRIVRALAPASRDAHEAFASSARFALLAGIVALAVWMRRRRPDASLFRRCGAALFAFLALSPAFGVQYLAWLVPWIALLPTGLALLHAAASGVFLVAVYTFWSGGFPWRYADSNARGTWDGWIVGAEIACWATVAAGAIALALARPRVTAPRGSAIPPTR